MSNLFVKVKEKQFGPFSKRELRHMVTAGKFSEEDMVWNADIDEWVQAKHIDDLKSIFPEINLESEGRRVIAIGGGKGGVGKTVLSASLGVGLAALGKQVVMVDADLGGANLHTCMGIIEPEFTFFDFYTLQRDSLEDIILDTPVENLRMISGACGTLGLANPKYSQKLRLIQQLRKINADFILLDLGAGASYNVIDFFIAADEGIVITTPDPMAIQEGFNFIKICLLRKLKITFREDAQIIKLLEGDEFNRPGVIRSPMDKLIEKVHSLDSQTGTMFESIIRDFKPKLMLNMVFDQNEMREGIAIRTAAAELLSIDVDYFGYIEYDESVRRSSKELRPFILNDPRSKPSRSLAKIITLKLLDKGSWDSHRFSRRMRRQIHEEAEEYPDKLLAESETICSVKCFYWGDCEFQNGGFPCSVRHLEPIFNQRQHSVLT